MARFCPNILLAKTDVGKVKPTNRHLPPDNWCYGRDFGRDPEGVGQGTFSKISFIYLFSKSYISMEIPPRIVGEKKTHKFHETQ